MQLKKGFTLIEIVYTVGIISILAGIGFISWEKMLERADTIEAQTNIGFVYTSQKQYFNECEHYYPDLELIQGVPEGPLSYNIGGLPQDDFTNIQPCRGENSYVCSWNSTSGCHFSFNRVCDPNRNVHESRPTPKNCFFKENSFSNFSSIYNQIRINQAYRSSMGSSISGVSRNFFMISAIKELKVQKNGTAIWDTWSIDSSRVLTNHKVELN